jgi:hypothetical protein
MEHIQRERRKAMKRKIEENSERKGRKETKENERKILVSLKYESEFRTTQEYFSVYNARQAYT